VRRYAGDQVRHVVVIGGIEAPRRRLRAPRPRRAAGAEPKPVEVTRATVIDAAPLGELEDADGWLGRAAGAEPPGAEALALLNRTLAGYRVSAADPWLADADPARALAFRIGYGTGEQVAEGEWEAARELPVPARRGARSLLLAPQERLAALLGGRDVALACEELALRARGDLDHGRGREAALQTSIALAAGLAELESWREDTGMVARLEELAGHREPVEAAVRTALEGGLDADALAAVEAALGRLEAALRARAVAVRDY
jgi:hypothetical protein